MSGWGLLASLRSGDAFELVPGSQHAEGPGVYFSEGVPRLTAAEGAAGRPTAIVEVELDVEGLPLLRCVARRVTG